MTKGFIANRKRSEPIKLNCPNCGADLNPRLKTSKLIACTFCDSTVFHHDRAVELAGKQGVMHDHPSLIRLGVEFVYANQVYVPIGHVRFSYGRGTWDEFWSLHEGEGVWISVDEGDIAIEKPVEMAERVTTNWLKVGEPVFLAEKDLLVTEIGTATTEAIQGEIPEPLFVGDQFRYAHLRGYAATLFTLEWSDKDQALSEGLWIDPFMIRHEHG